MNQTPPGPTGPRFNVTFSAKGLVVAERRGVVIAMWRRKPTWELFDIQKKALDVVVSKNPGKSAFICVVESTSEPPDDDIRKASSSMVTAHEKNLKCVALVIEGSGFRSAITRTVLSGMVMIARTPSPIRFFDTPTSACAWVGTQLVEPREQLIEEIEALRLVLDTH